jgi:hypothetical protein
MTKQEVSELREYFYKEDIKETITNNVDEVKEEETTQAVEDHFEEEEF